jgi:hypothetical protein
MTIVISPKSMPAVWNVVRNAIPVTTPGSAIGRMNRNEIVSRPKKVNRWMARAASDPSTSAIAVAPVAAISEFTSARRTAAFAAASMNQSSENEVGGHACERLSLNA